MDGDKYKEGKKKTGGGGGGKFRKRGYAVKREKRSPGASGCVTNRSIKSSQSIDAERKAILGWKRRPQGRVKGPVGQWAMGPRAGKGGGEDDQGRKGSVEPRPQVGGELKPTRRTEKKGKKPKKRAAVTTRTRPGSKL